MQCLTGIDCVPVPQHLRSSASTTAIDWQLLLTEILQLGPSPPPIPMPIPPMSIDSDAVAAAADAVEVIDMPLMVMWSIVEDGMLMLILIGMLESMFDVS